MKKLLGIMGSPRKHGNTHAMEESVLAGAEAHGATTLMKDFIDRFVYFNCELNRDGVRNKNAVVVVPFEEEDLATAYLVLELFRKSLEFLEMNFVRSVASR